MNPACRRTLALCLIASLSGCATNPATGKRQLMLVSEAQEGAMGQEADEQFHGLYGDFEDAKLQAYVESVAKPLAAASERPNLPWTFRVVDDPQVNAFALPGGYIYVTRGILAHMNSEAELAGVLGHEIGHVTARHSASAQSRQMLGMVGLGVSMILSPTLRKGGDALGGALGLVFLKFGRDQESQADGLGLRYIVRKDYDPRRMLDVFRMLDGVTNAAGGDRLPNWLSTHPAPPNRLADIDRAITEQRVSGTRVGRDEYLRRLDGLMFGENPREGFFRGDLFLHPDMAFTLTFPSGWMKQNEKQGVSAMPQAKDALVQLSLANGDVESALAEFGRQKGVEVGRTDRSSVGGFPAMSAAFRLTDEQGAVMLGVVTFVRQGSRTLQLLGYAPEARYPSYRNAFEAWARSFSRLDDPRVLNAQALRLRIETLRAPATPAALARDWNSPVKAETLALINGVGVNDTIPAGALVKRVTGEVVR